MSDPKALRLREALGNFVTGVTVVTTRYGTELHGLTANSFTSVSLDPPLVLFSLSRTADCFDAFEQSDYFAINVLRSDQESLSNRFATKDIDKWSEVRWRPGHGDCPLLDGVIATFECRVTTRYEGGDHVIYVGEVLRFDQSPEGEPLAFFRGRYTGIAG